MFLWNQKGGFIGLRNLSWLLLVAFSMSGCMQRDDNRNSGGADAEVDWQWQTEQFADLRILRYKVPGFAELPLPQKQLLYYLYEAAVSGRDVIYDQNYKHNLYIRRTLENAYQTYGGTRAGDDWTAFHTYLKRIWFSNGIHHHYSYKKFEPGFTEEYFEELIRNSDPNGYPLQGSETVEELLVKLSPILFDPALDAKRVNKAQGADMVSDSANNYYENVTQEEVEAYYAARIDPSEEEPVSWGLNSKLIKENGALAERVWKIGGMYGKAIEKVVYWLKKAVSVAENDEQRRALELLVEYYETGDLRRFDAYNIAWVDDTKSNIDVISGFIESYGDAVGYRGAYESVVQLVDPVATRRIKAISREAQWFEDHSPIDGSHKKSEVKGISARVINVVMEAGDASPDTPIGINLPNANWIRAKHGSKSVNLANIVAAYDEASKASGMLEEFAHSEEEILLSREHGSLADNLQTDMHEVIGHASGRLNPGVRTPKETLKSYASTLEECRADLVALYYLMDPKLIEIGVMASLDVGKTQYNDYIRNGMLLQLRRLEAGENVEEAHMRNRQLVCKWVIEKGAPAEVVTRETKDGKTYFVVRDYEKLRDLFGQLLREVQRIKSEGDYEAARDLVESYGVQVEATLHQEVLKRVERLKIAPYSGFINPVLKPMRDESGTLTDVTIEYPDDFTQQHLYYSENYGFLPVHN